MVNLEHKVALITGASRGLGRTMALQLASAGAKIVVNFASDSKAAQDVVAEIKARGGSAVAVKADVSREQDVQQLYEESLRYFGKLDIVINNAGIMKIQPLKDFSETDFDRQFAVNVKSVFLMMKHAAGILSDKGRIINISSSTTRLMMPGYGVYSAAKAAVEQMTRVFAKETGHRHITVNSVLPGPVNTELFRNGKSEELVQRIASLSAFSRIGEVEDIVPLVLFIATEESQWMTGQCIGINGGMA